MDYFIDMHCHILPHVDDGARNWKVSQTMLEIAYQQGIRKIIATPHYKKGTYENKAEDLKKYLVKINTMAESISSNLKIYLGQESYYCNELTELLNNGSILTMAESHYVLLEYMPITDFRTIKNGVQQLLMEDYLPVLAHIERYQALSGKLDRLDELRGMGAYLQVNMDSVMGNRGLKTKGFLRKALKKEMIDFISTDAHGLNRRPPHLQQGAGFLEKKYGRDYTRLLLKDNAKKILKDQVI